MQKPSEQGALDDAPLYIRWNADRSPYAIELKLDLVQKISNELDQAQKLGIEIGGILIGALPTEYAPTLRIDDVEMLPRDPKDGPIYMLDQGQHERFSQIRWKPRAAGRAGIGFFRTEEQIRALDAYSKKHGVSRAEAVRRAIAVFLPQRTHRRLDLSNHPAFGSWKGRSIDSVEFQRKLRTEWGKPS